MASSQNSLEENLKCSICLDIFKDPVMLSCSHSFCKACLDIIWNQRDVKKCPLCRKKTKRTPFNNQALREACDSFVEEKKRKISEESQGAICLDHAEKHQLFCMDDKKLVCMQCVSQNHQNHSFSSISKVASEYKTKLQGPLQELQNNQRQLNLKKLNYTQLSKEAMKPYVQQTENQIRAEFVKLHQFLREEEEARITALKEEEEQSIKTINDKIKEIEEMVSDLSERIKSTEDYMNGDESLLLHNFKDIEDRTKFTMPSLKLDRRVLNYTAKHLGNLKYSVWEKMKDLCPYYPVVLVPGGGESNLQISGDLTSVGARPGVTLPENKIQPVLGSEGFTSGTHSWVVEVGNSEHWVVGVYSESASGVRSPCSLITLINGKSSWSPTAPKFTKVRVMLDSEKHQVLYTDPDTNTMLQTHSCSFTEKLYPCFVTRSQVPLKILPAKVSVTVSSI